MRLILIRIDNLRWWKVILTSRISLLSMIMNILWLAFLILDVSFIIDNFGWLSGSLKRFSWNSVSCIILVFLNRPSICDSSCVLWLNWTSISSVWNVLLLFQGYSFCCLNWLSSTLLHIWWREWGIWCLGSTRLRASSHFCKSSTKWVRLRVGSCLQLLSDWVDFSLKNCIMLLQTVNSHFQIFSICVDKHDFSLLF